MDIKKAIQKVAKTKPGRDFLEYLMKDCGFQDSSVVRSASTDAKGNQNFGDILPNIVIYNEAKRDTWIRIRRHLSRSQIIAIEAGKEEHDDD